jgi:hypothetical protein
MTLIETLKKYTTKTTLIVSLVVLSSILSYTTCNQHSKLTQVRTELKAEQGLNSIVNIEKHRLDSLVIYYGQSIKERDAIISQKDKKILAQSKTITLLQDSLKHTLINVGSITADSSYKYINLRIPPVAPLKYGFDSLQIKKIHYTFLERDGLFDINTKQTILINDLTLSSALKDSQIDDLKNLNSIYKSKLAISEKEVSVYKGEVVGLNKVIRQQRFLKNILLPPAAIGVAAIIIKILVK